MGTSRIREIRKTDNQQLATIIKTVFLEFDAPKNGTVYSDPTTNSLFELFQVPNSVLFVIEENGVLMGCCGIYPTEGLPSECIEVVKFYITSSGRGKGYGKALYLACEAEAEKLGFKQLYLESIPDFKTALGLYEKLGFKALDKPLGNSGHFGCNIWLLKKL